MRRERVVHTERTPWAGWVYAVLWGVVVMAAYPMLAGWDTDLSFPMRVLAATGFVAFAVLLHLFAAGLIVRVYEDRVVVAIGRLGVIRRTVSADEIEAIEPVRYRPILEFGGWGIRGWGRKKAWTARGDEAVVLTLTGERRLYIGSDNPQRLAERIRTAVRERDV